MTSEPLPADTIAALTGEARMADRVRAFDWAATPLGPIDAWPQSLRTAVDVCLNSPLPMFVWWGPGLINVYNDAYAPVLGRRHPDALGRPAREVWHDIWPAIGADVDEVVLRGKPILKHRVRFVMERNGYAEETFFTYAHSPVRAEDGSIGGLIQVCNDDTAAVLAERERERAEQDRARADDARRAADERARSILESITDAFFAVDRAWRFTYLNPQAETLLDAAGGALIGRVIWDAFPGLIGSGFERAYRRAMDEGVAGSVLSHYPDHDRWYDVRVYPSADGVSIYFRDATERERDKRSREEMAGRHAEASRRYERMLSAIGDYAYTFDLAGRFAYANRALLDFFGLPAEQVVGKAPAELGYPPELAERIGSQVRRVVETGEQVVDETPFTNAAGVTIHFRYVFRPIVAPGGRVEAVAGSASDVTQILRAAEALRASEARYRTLFESMDEGFCVIEVIREPGTGRPVDYRFLEMNPAFEGHTGLRDAVGRTVRELVPAHEPFWFEAYGDVARTGTPARFVHEASALGRWYDVRASRAGGPADDRVAVLFRDVTDRARAELERERLLREVELERQRLAELFQRSPAFIAVLRGPGHVFERANDRYLDLIGRGRPIVGRAIAEALPEAAAQGFVAVLDGVYRTGEAFVGRDVRVTIARGAGGAVEERFLDFVYEPLRDAAGETVGIVVHGVDLTERKRAEAALRESEAEFRRLADAMPQIVWAARPDGTVDYYNRRWYEYTGLPEGVIGEPSWAPVIPDEDLARIVPVWLESLRTGLPHETECRYRRASDGQYRWHLSRALPIRDDEGRVVRWFGTNTDVHDQKIAADALRESREQLAVAIDAGRLGTWQVELATLEMTCSDTCKRNYGQPTDRPFTYETLWASVHPDDRADAQARVRHAIETGEDYVAEYRVIWPDGTTHWASARGRVAYAADGTPTRIAGVSQDVTERKRAEAERDALLARERAARAESEQARAEGEEAGRMKDEFLATLSHELRTPLSAILGWSQILRRPSMRPETLAEGLSTIERNARVQTQIIEDLLDMSRIVSGKIALDAGRIDLTGVIEAAIATVHAAASAKQVEVLFDGRGTRRPVLGDVNRLQQVFWNLLTNAVKFTPRGGTVRISVSQRHSQWQVDVADSGEGIAPQFLPYVFDRFRQADASTTRKHGGLGLGLAIVKQLAELHGGRVRVSSEGAGRGATFTVSLPVSVLHEPAPGDGTRPIQLGAGEASASTSAEPNPSMLDGAWDLTLCEDVRGRTAVIVDDEPDARAMLARLLGECGVSVHVAADADEALALIERERPDVLVSDIGMPGTDGYALLARVRALGPDRGGQTPAIALTAYARADDRVRAVRAGFQMHVPKPVEPAELMTMLSSLIRRR